LQENHPAAGKKGENISGGCRPAVGMKAVNRIEIGTAMTEAKIVAVSTSLKKGEKKTNVPQARLFIDHGLDGDAHAGDWHRQVSLLDMESVTRIRAKGLGVAPGNFAENITTQGIRLWELPIGTRMQLGRQALVEVTQIGKACHNRCAIFHQVGDCVMPREGIFAKVLKEGTIRPGDVVKVLEQQFPPHGI
jgi:MOSC domain-containing protein YiiM